MKTGGGKLARGKAENCRRRRQPIVGIFQSISRKIALRNVPVPNPNDMLING